MVNFKTVQQVNKRDGHFTEFKSHPQKTFSHARRSVYIMILNLNSV